MTFEAYEVDGAGGVRRARWLGPAIWGLRAGAVGCATLAVAGAMALFGTVRWGWAFAVALVAVTGLWLWWRGMAQRRLRRRLRAEGEVLAGAEVTVHAVTRASVDELDRDEAAEVDPAADDLYRLDVTVAPRRKAAADDWTPGSLRWLPPGVPARPRSPDDRCGALDVEVWQGGRFVAEMGSAWRGTVRVRSVARVPRGSRRVRLGYVYETLATVDLEEALRPAAAAETSGEPRPRKPTGCRAIHDHEGEYVGLGPDPPQRFRGYDYGSTIPAVWNEVAALGRDLGFGDLDAFVCPEPAFRRAEDLGEEIEEAAAEGDAERAEELRRARAALWPDHDPAELNRLVRALASHLRGGGESELAELALLDLEAYAHALDWAAANDRRVFVSPY